MGRMLINEREKSEITQKKESGEKNISKGKEKETGNALLFMHCRLGDYE